MSLSELPATAAWDHSGSRRGFEVAAFARTDGGWIVTGATTAVEADVPWWVTYEIELTSSFVTRRAAIAGRTGPGTVSAVRIEGDGLGRWTVDDRAEPGLDGCLDLDLESSAMTNTLPLRRLDPRPTATVWAPAVYVRAQGLAVERLEQSYARREDGARSGPSVDYEAPAFDFACRIDYDSSGLVVDYPGIARRVQLAR
ncbi:MAG: uncharacterized protein QOC66_2525 [Pseudonocardiales bacterium]|nr:uncharacterized protein [Pseudonocardiales bacterium]